VIKFRWKHHHSFLWKNYRPTGEWQAMSTCDGGKENQLLTGRQDNLKKNSGESSNPP